MTDRASLTLPVAVAALGIAIFAGMDAVMKHLAIAIGAYNAIFWRIAISFLLLGPLFVLRGGRWPDRAVTRLHIGRGATMAVALFLYFWGLKNVPLAQGIALSFISPLIALSLAAAFLKERIAASSIGASVAAFGGVLIIVAFQPGGHQPAASWQGQVAILVGAIFYAVSVVIGRRQAQLASPLEVAMFFNLVAGAFFLTGAPWFVSVPAAEHLPALLAATLLANVSIMLIAWAYARAETQYLLPLEYTAFLWAALFGWLAFGERVSPATLAGAVLIVGACLWAARGRTGFPPAEVDLMPGTEPARPATADPADS